MKHKLTPVLVRSVCYETIKNKTNHDRRSEAGARRYAEESYPFFNGKSLQSEKETMPPRISAIHALPDNTEDVEG